MIDGSVDRNNPKLMAMMDTDGMFRSFLDRAAPDVERFAIELVGLANVEYETAIRYFTTDGEPSAANTQRDNSF